MSTALVFISVHVPRCATSSWFQRSENNPDLGIYALLYHATEIIVTP